MGRVGRRAFIRGTVGTAGALAMAGPFQGFVASAAAASNGRGNAIGPLAPVPDLLDGEVRLALPPGFVYRTLSAAGDVMSDGVPTPARQDGMAAFRGPRGSIRVIRNHEINVSGAPFAMPARPTTGTRWAARPPSRSTPPAASCGVIGSASTAPRSTVLVGRPPGHVAQHRRDGERSRRRRRLRRPGSRLLPAARLRLRGRLQVGARGASIGHADPQRRPDGPRGGRRRPERCRRLSHRGPVPVPGRHLPLPPSPLEALRAPNPGRGTSRDAPRPGRDLADRTGGHPRRWCVL